MGHVTAARQHPNADRLQLCVVDIGGGQSFEVVCGAPNARAGMTGVFAPEGTWIPGTGIKLKKSKIRGVESNGMLCSEAELGLSTAEFERLHEFIVRSPSFDRASRERIRHWPPLGRLQALRLLQPPPAR